jgi:hypothetical protein
MLAFVREQLEKAERDRDAWRETLLLVAIALRSSGEFTFILPEIFAASEISRCLGFRLHLLS